MLSTSFSRAASFVALLLSINLNQDVTAFLIPNPISVRKSSVSSFSYFPNREPDFNKKSSSGKTFILKKNQLQRQQQSIGISAGTTKSSQTTKITESNSFFSKNNDGDKKTNSESSQTTKITASNSFFSKSDEGDKKKMNGGKNNKSPKKMNGGKNSKSPKKTASSPSFGNMFQSSKPKTVQASPKAKSKENKKTNSGKNSENPKKTASSPTFGNLFQSSEPKQNAPKANTAPKSTSPPSKKMQSPSAGNFFISPKPSSTEAKVKSAPEKVNKVENPTPSRPLTPIEKLNSANSDKVAPKLEPSAVLNFFDKIKNPVGTSNSKDEEVKLKPGEEIITNDITGFTTTILTNRQELKDIPEANDPAPKSEFNFPQRIESIKAGVVGLIAGGLALAPIAAFHDILFPGDSIANGVAQWEFDTDTGSITTALFAIVYRYCVRDGEEKNEMLQMGVVGAFVLVRTLARIRVPVYCSAAPLDCGDPFGYFDSAMIQQAVGSGLESMVMFGATALALEYCYENGYISRFK